MIDPQGDVYKRLTGDSELASMLGRYAAVEVALFSDFVPSDLTIEESPVGVVSAPITNTQDDTYDQDYRRVELNVRFYHRPSGSSLILDQAADKARSVLKLWPAGAITGGSLVSATVTGPVSAPTDDPSLSGRLLNVRLLIKET